MPHSLLMIPVPEAESVVRPRLERQSAESLPSNPDDIVAQITLLTPFADLDAIDDGLRAELRDFFADVVPFPFLLTGLFQFPGGTAYLAPDPATPFRALTHELFACFPEFPPYGGDFENVVPHLPIPMTDGESIEQLRFEVGSRLPISAHAQEAALYWYEPGNSRILERFTFGTAAA